MRKDRTLEKLRAYFASADFTRPPFDDALPSGFSSTLDEANSLLPPDVLRQSLIARLEKFRYAYPEARSTEKTFYKQVQAAGILDSLLTGELFWTIRFWLLLEYERCLEKELEGNNLSPYGCPSSFHRKMVKRLIAHPSIQTNGTPKLAAIRHDSNPQQISGSQWVAWRNPPLHL
jgi:hypothetical protein